MNLFIYTFHLWHRQTLTANFRLINPGLPHYKSLLMTFLLCNQFVDLIYLAARTNVLKLWVLNRRKDPTRW
jgi:hypothetical protein